MKKFKKIYIEITNRCNLNCSFCLQSRRPKAFLSVEAFDAILNQIQAYTGHITLHVLGEPLLHPELGHLLGNCHDHHLRVNLCTNGTLISQHRNLLLNAPAMRQINISLHSIAENTAGADLKDVLSVLFDFAEEATNLTSTFISFRLWNIEETISTPQSARTRQILSRMEHFFNLPAAIPEKPTPGYGISLAPRIFLSLERPFKWPREGGKESDQYGTCRGLRDHVAVLVDGTVVPCCLDAEADIPLGNIFKQSFSEIISGPRANSIRKGFTTQRLVEPMCRHCTYRRRFGSPKNS